MLMRVVRFWKFECSSANTDDSGRITGKPEGIGLLLVKPTTQELTKSLKAPPQYA